MNSAEKIAAPLTTVSARSATVATDQAMSADVRATTSATSATAEATDPSQGQVARHELGEQRERPDVEGVDLPARR